MTAVVTNEAIQQRVAAWFPGLADRRRYQVHTDASDFYRVDYGDALIADGFGSGDVSIRTAERDGPSLAKLILAEMTALEAGTLVVGRQGLSRKEEFLFASASKQIVSHARQCTVWVVQ